MQKQQEVYPLQGMSLSLDETNMPANKARFIRGWTHFVNNNAESGNGAEIGNLNKLTKSPSNQKFGDVALPSGLNMCIGGGYVKETSQYYSCIWNSQGNHSIWQLDAKTKTSTLVIQNSCLNFILNPVHFVSKTRFAYVTYQFYSRGGNTATTKTWLFITDDANRTKQIPVEDCIATNGLTHSFFQSGDCCSVCDMITMGAPGKPVGCIGMASVDRDNTPEENAMYNDLSLKVWQFRLRYVDVWGRESVDGVISEQYYNGFGTGCDKLNDSMYPRCVDLSFDMGCKDIDKIKVEYRLCGVGNHDDVNTDWVLHETIEKYDECDASGLFIEEFWLRIYKSKYNNPISNDNGIVIDEPNNKMTYRFCGNKESRPIPIAESSLGSLRIPNKSKGLFKLGNKIGTTNNEYGFKPLLCGQKNNIRFEASTDSNNSCSPNEYVTITIWGYIYSPLDNKLTNIRKFAKTSGGGIDSIGYGVTGPSDGSYVTAKYNPYFYNQYMNTDSGIGVKNFIMYAVGHDNVYVEAKQMDITNPNSPIEVGVMDKRSSDKKYIQMWKFHLPKGKYIFRVSDPKTGIDKSIVNGGEQYYRTKSANVIGLTSLANPGALIKEQYELSVEANSDINLIATPLLIWDLTRDAVDPQFGNHANAVEGYVTNNLTSLGKKIGVEYDLVQADAVGSGTVFHSHQTDANGHYFGTCEGDALLPGNVLRFNIADYYCGGSVMNSDWSKNIQQKEYVYSTDIEYTDKTHFTIKGQILDSVSSLGISGMVVVYENSHYAITDQDGKFEIYANGGINAFRSDKLILANRVGSACVYTRIGSDCDTNFEKFDVLVPDCTISDKTFTISNMLVKSLLLDPSTRGIFKGKYGVGIVLEDCIGIETYVQADDESYVEFSDVLEDNVIKYNLTGLDGLNDYKWLSFYVTENLVYSDWLEWIVDYAVLEDNNGNIAPQGATLTNPARLRVYVNSLANYTAYSQANTSWQFIEGDLIQFFEKGGGDSINIQSLVSYRVGQPYVTVTYNDSMADLYSDITGAKIRLLRPRIKDTTEKYFQLCQYVKINNGLPETTQGDLSFKNTFRITRAIPEYINTVNTQDAVVNEYDLAGEIIKTRIENIPISIPTATNTSKTYILNHNSPSDFFGSKCYGKGRVNFKNPYERIHRLTTEIALSNGISNEGNTNYLHWFTDINAVSFDEQVYHGITAVIAEQNIILAICTNDWFSLLYDQNEFRTDEKTGQIFATSAVNKFGKPRTKSGGNYGCGYNDVNTIAVNDGIVFYLDAKNNLIVRHSFESIENFTPDDIKGYLHDKIVEVSTYNSTRLANKWKYFHGIVDPKNNTYLLSTFKLDKSDKMSWVNQLREESVSENETFVIGSYGKEPILYSMPHYTPESFGILQSENIGIQLVSFKYGIPYIHYPSNQTDYLNYYGYQCKPILEFIFNLEPALNKNFLSMITKIKQHLLYSDKIITESGQISYVMPWSWVRGNNEFSSAFRCQTNGVQDPNKPNNTNQNAIVDYQTLFGKWARVRLVSMDKDDNKYAELYLIVTFVQILQK